MARPTGDKSNYAGLKKQYRANAKIAINKILLNKTCQIDLPGIGESTDIITARRIDTIKIIQTAALAGKVQELFISTFSVSETTIRALMALGLTPRIYISNHHGQIAETRHVLKELAVDYVTGDVHAKVVLLKTETEWYVVVGSGNFSANAKEEQFTIRNDRGLYTFYRGWFISKWQK